MMVKTQSSSAADWAWSIITYGWYVHESYVIPFGPLLSPLTCFQMSNLFSRSNAAWQFVFAHNGAACMWDEWRALFESPWPGFCSIALLTPSQMPTAPMQGHYSRFQSGGELAHVLLLCMLKFIPLCIGSIIIHSPLPSLCTCLEMLRELPLLSNQMRWCVEWWQ